jgi:medium-chain acyl-[acyl-carrier-protein] hydrolase
MARVRLFCFAYAGGGASIFHSWPDQLPSGVETIGIQMPGVGSRIIEPPIEEIAEVVQLLVLEIGPKLGKPYVFFGHSLGGLISFELALELRKRYGLYPLHVFVAGIRAPQILSRNPPIHDLPDTNLLEELQRRYNGIPEEISKDRDILQLVLPGLRAGLKMHESYRYRKSNPLDCGITAFGGYQDRAVRRQDLEAWHHQTKRSFTLHMLPGGHFFINSEHEHFLKILYSELAGILAQLR